MSKWKHLFYRWAFITCHRCGDSWHYGWQLDAATADQEDSPYEYPRKLCDECFKTILSPSTSEEIKSEYEINENTI